MLPLIAVLFSIALPAGSPGLACSAVPLTEIEQAVGQRLEAAPEVTKAGDSTCSYSAGGVTVAVELQHLDGPLDLPSELEQLRGTFPGSTLQKVTGLGAIAFAMQIPGAGTQLHVLPDARDYVLVSVLGLDQDRDSLAVAARIARAVLSRKSPASGQGKTSATA